MLLAIWCYKDWGTTVSDLQHTLKGIQDEDQEWWISDLGSWQNSPLNSQIFSEENFVSLNYYIVSYLEKQKKKSLMNSSQLTVTSCQDMRLNACTSLPKSHVYWPLPHLFRAAPQSWESISQVIVLISA